MLVVRYIDRLQVLLIETRFDVGDITIWFPVD